MPGSAFDTDNLNVGNPALNGRRVTDDAPWTPSGAELDHSECAVRSKHRLQGSQPFQRTAVEISGERIILHLTVELFNTVCYADIGYASKEVGDIARAARPQVFGKSFKHPLGFNHVEADRFSWQL